MVLKMKSCASEKFAKQFVAGSMAGRGYEFVQTGSFIPLWVSKRNEASFLHLMDW